MGVLMRRSLPRRLFLLLITILGVLSIMYIGVRLVIGDYDGQQEHALPATDRAKGLRRAGTMYSKLRESVHSNLPKPSAVRSGPDEFSNQDNSGNFIKGKVLDGSSPLSAKTRQKIPSNTAKDGQNTNNTKGISSDSNPDAHHHIAQNIRNLDHRYEERIKQSLLHNQVVPLDPIVEAPFKLKDSVELERAYKRWDKQKFPTLQSLLWAKYRVAKVGKGEGYHSFALSLHRHIALFYGEYLRKGGKEPRHFGIFECRDLALDGINDEKRTNSLDDVAGSQGTLVVKRTQLNLPTDQAKNFPFDINVTDQGAEVLMIAKYFRATQSKSKSEHGPSQDFRTMTQKEYLGARKNFKRELKALNRVTSPFLIHAVCKKTDSLEIVYPKLAGGDLVLLGTDAMRQERPVTSGQTESTMDKQTKYLSPDETFLPRFTRQLVLAVVDFHKQGLLHLDLKPENLVVAGPDRKFIQPWDSKELGKYYLILIDYGLSLTQEDAESISCYQKGTKATMAPEQVLCNNPVSKATDWWGVAAAIYRTRVFWEPSLEEKERDVILKAKCPQWGHPIFPMQPFFDPQLSDLLNMMLTADPANRQFDAKIELLLNHPYLLRGQ